MTPEEENVIRRCRAVLLDFDGPVCDAFAGYPAPRVARDMVSRAVDAGVSVPLEIKEETDPMEVLRGLFKIASEWHSEAERVLREAETVSVTEASPTSGAIEFMEACRETGRPLVVVSNNSPEAVNAFLGKHGLASLTLGIFGRSRLSPKLMKPHPHLLEVALEGLSAAPGDCLMVGDSATDIEVAKVMGVPVAGYANKAGKAERFRALGSDVVTEDMAELATQLRAAGPLT
ncbi:MULTISPECIES: HAD family hydrolase [unclassified Nocardiopsis]|uniref:HAD family hydrolase n=1 Tax=Nocardiopsis TaxID=2013 RepID=UPI00387AB583